MIRKTARLIIRFRVVVLLAILAGTLFFLYQLKGIRMACGGGDIKPELFINLKYCAATNISEHIETL